MTTLWWEHDSFHATRDDITCDGHSLTALARRLTTPCYVYSRATVRRQLAALTRVLEQAGARPGVFYAMKANRHPGVLAAVREAGVGVDVCSPRELALAQALGFRPSEISFNAGMLANRDLAAVAAAGTLVTLDSFSALRRYAACAPRSPSIGLRFDPGVRASYHDDPRLVYAQAKFGFEPDALDDAIASARALGLRVESLHMHLGWGLPASADDEVAAAFRRLAELARRVDGLEAVNIGGGLGGRYVKDDAPLRLERWAELVRRELVPLGLDIRCEPGTFVAAPCGVLLVEVNTVERRRGVDWVGIDAGFAVNLNPAAYGIALTAVLLRDPFAPASERYTLAGNINEAGDIWARDLAMPSLREGDLLALLPAGAYGASMASDHCLRGRPAELAL